MATFCKTSQGGINLDAVTDWLINGIYNDGEYHDLIIFMNAGEQEGFYPTSHYDGDEAQRLIEILNRICIFDATQELSK